MKWCIRILILIVLVLGFSSLGYATTIAKAGTADVTVTATGLVVASAEGFTIYYISDTEVGISWTMPEGADQIMIRAKYGSYPDAPPAGEEPTDGYLVYYGSEESTSDTAVMLDETASGVYYRAFTQTAGGAWSPTYAEGWIQGGGVTLIAIFLLGGILIVAAARSSYEMIRYIGGFYWIGVFIWWVTDPPTGFDAGSTGHTGFLVVFIGMALMLFFMPQWFTRRTATGEERGGFNIRLPRMLGGKTQEEEEEERRLSSRTYRDRHSEYWERLSNASRGVRYSPRFRDRR